MFSYICLVRIGFKRIFIYFTSHVYWDVSVINLLSQEERCAATCRPYGLLLNKWLKVYASFFKRGQRFERLASRLVRND